MNHLKITLLTSSGTLGGPGLADLYDPFRHQMPRFYGSADLNHTCWR